MLAVIHAQPRIDWQREFTPKLETGLRTMGVPYRISSERQRQDGLPILLGTTHWRPIEATGDYLLVDRCSFGDTNRWVTLVRNGHGRRGDHRVPDNPSPARWERYGVPVQPWRDGKRRVLCGQTETYSPHYATLTDWYASVQATHFRRHPAGQNPTGLPELRHWNEVGLAITLNSSVAVDAVLAGVPTVTMDEGAMARDVSSHVPHETSKPPRLPPHASKLIDALAGGGRRAWVYLPDATEAQCVSATSDSLRVSRQPFNIATALSSHPAVVSYGGHGLGLTALTAGCPQLLLPVNGEQHSTAKRLVELGVGVCVGQGEPRSKVVAGLARVLEDEKIAASARSEAEALREFSPDRALESAIDACCLAAAASRDVPGLARRH